MKIKNVFNVYKWLALYLNSKCSEKLEDKYYIKLNYIANMKKKLNLENPVTYNEKLQWLKLYDRNPLYTTLVDKYEVKEYVANLIGKEHVIPTLGIWDNFEDIELDKLPQKFVLKCTHDSGGLIICKNKDTFDRVYAKIKLESCLGRNYYTMSREWPYKNVKPRIIAEVYMDDYKPGEVGYGKGLTDYKFFTFNGESKFLYISKGLDDHSTAKISFFDLKGKRLPFKRADYECFEEDVVMPPNFQKMIELSNKLAKYVGAPFLRVDFYDIDGQVYFSEFTFYPCSGFIPFDPENWDVTLGGWLNLPNK